MLHELDDGSKSLEESVAMMAMAAEAGTTDLVSTPHCDLRYKFDPDMIAARAGELRARCPAPRLYTGCDFHLTYDNIQDALAHPSKYTINQRKYLLVEFSDLLIFQNSSDIFESLLAAGMVPVITHPERNSLLHQRLEQLGNWVDAGCRIQVTAQSLTGRFGKSALKFSVKLIESGLVHFLASDAHDTEHRPPVLSYAYEWVSREYGEDFAELLLAANPCKALHGEAVEASPVPAKRRRWFGFA